MKVYTATRQTKGINRSVRLRTIIRCSHAGDCVDFRASGVVGEEYGFITVAEAVWAIPFALSSVGKRPC